MDDRHSGRDPAQRRQAEALYDANVRLIEFTLHRFFTGLRPRGLERDEAWTAAALGLWLACLRYQTSRGAFGSYAVRCIRGHVLHHLRGERSARRLPTVALDAPLTEGEDGGSAYDVIADPDAEVPGSALLSEASLDLLWGRLGGLTEMQRKALWGVYGRGETVAAVGARLGVTGSRVHQAAAAGLKRLRAQGMPRPRKA